MPRGSEKKEADLKRWRTVEENNNNDAFNSQKGLQFAIKF